jgi:hypothetical protein
MTTLESIEVVESGGSSRSGEAWSAIIGGAVGAAAVSLILLVLGAGLGLSVMSPWAGSPSAGQIAVTSVIWLILVQWVASAFGGYLTGRMREQTEPSDEVFFRDTANGFLAWALATLVAAAILASATSALIGATARIAGGAAATMAVAGAASAGSDNSPVSYFSDMLLRPLPGSHPEAAAVAAAAPNLAPPSTPASPELRSEVGRVLVHGLAQPDFPAADVSYLAQVVAERSGLSADAAQARVNDTIAAFRDATAKVKAAADAARHQAAKLSIYMFLSLIVGAFIACAAAALGGVHRDERPSRLAL